MVSQVQPYNNCKGKQKTFFLIIAMVTTDQKRIISYSSCLEY